MPVLIEPLVKLLRPIVLLVSPRADGWNRAYLLFITFWTLLTWGIFGGAITRLAAVQLTGKDRPGLFEAVRFVTARYVSYILSPAVPLICVALIAILSVLYGLIHLIPVVGDIADSVAWPFLMLLGFGQAILLIGMVGYPLMYATISAEGSDTFDALSRSYNYVLQSPWNYIWYSIVAVVYGAVLVFFVGFVGSMVVYLTKWSVGLTPGTEYFASRRVENLFIYAPTSFGWRDLLIGVEPGMDPDARVASLASSFYWWNYLQRRLCFVLGHADLLARDRICLQLLLHRLHADLFPDAPQGGRRRFGRGVSRRGRADEPHLPPRLRRKLVRPAARRCRWWMHRGRPPAMALRRRRNASSRG